MDVSIHAPARGATQRSILPERIVEVSIHAPARGATEAVPKGWALGKRFNPRPCARGDRLVAWI